MRRVTSPTVATVSARAAPAGGAPASVAPDDPMSMVRRGSARLEEPREGPPERVPPAHPVVAVELLDEAHVHAGVLEHGDDRPVLADQRLEDAARDDDPVGDGLRLAHVVADELAHRSPQPLGAGPAADPGAGERARLDEETAEEAGRRGG